MSREASRTIPLILTVVAAVVATTTRAQETGTLEQKVEALEGQIKELRRQVQGVARSAFEVGNVRSTKHFAGYADVGFSDRERGPEEFDGVRFSPAFHYQYQDLILLDVELETSIDQEGATDVELEFATLNLLVHDYAAVFAGRFLSPLGQFQQNLHPSWINKLPSVPVGFGHDQAAPSRWRCWAWRSPRPRAVPKRHHLASRFIGEPVSRVTVKTVEAPFPVSPLWVGKAGAWKSPMRFS